MQYHDHTGPAHLVSVDCPLCRSGDCFASLGSLPIAEGTRACIFGFWVVGTGAVPFLFAAFGIGPELQFPVFAAVLALTIGLATSQVGNRFADVHGLALLAAFQVFRAPLEYVLVIWYEAGFMPVQMTWHGDNLDVVTGIFALPAAVLIWRGLFARMVALVFNLMGIYFLCRIVLIVGLSSPTPLRAFSGGYEMGPDVLVGMSFPSIWIGTVAVAGAFFLHFASLRHLMGRIAP